MDTLASTGADMLIQHGIPWLGKKAVEMGRYYGSEALRKTLNCRRKLLIMLFLKQLLLFKRLDQRCLINYQPK